jgi:aryl-alcohol dehydrogenase-like predicted oxidoreductase
MEYVRFGGSNLMVSRLAMGAMGFGSKDWREWVLDLPSSRKIIKKCLDGGINFFDTCDFYSAGKSEEMLHTALIKSVKREEIVLATKVGNPMGAHPNARGFSRKHVSAAIDASLKRLGTDYVDIYQTHIWDPSADLEELVDAFTEVVRAGKARYIGVTTMPAWTLCKLRSIAKSKHLPLFVSMQCEYNLAQREAERELLPFCQSENIAVVPFSPFARGFLCADRRKSENVTPRTRSDDYTLREYYREGDFKVLEAISKIAIEHDLTPAQVALVWVLKQPLVTAPIFGATIPEHVSEALSCLDIDLDESVFDPVISCYQSRGLGRGGH